MSRRKSSHPQCEPSVTASTNRHSPSHRSGESSVRGRYQQQQQHYLQQDFTSQCNAYVREICAFAGRHTHLRQLPVREALLNVCRILLLNQLELLFLHSLLQGLDWNIEDQLVVNSLPAMKRISNNENGYSKQTHLYLLLAGYSVKVYLNESDKMFEGVLTEMLPNFLSVFGLWCSKYAKPGLAINPKKLNRLYIDGNHRTPRKKVLHYEDLNVKVADLVDHMPIPDPDSGDEVVLKKEQSIGNMEQEQELEHDDIHWEDSMPNNRINDQNNMIEDMPQLAWPFRGDSIMSVNSQPQDLWHQLHHDYNNLPTPPLTKRRSIEPEFALRVLSEHPE